MRLKNENGFTLVEIAVTLGISGIFTIMFMRYSLNSYSQDAHLNYLAKINESLTSVQYAMLKPENCQAMFQGRVLNTSGTDVLDGIKVKDQVLLKPGETPYFNVSSIKLFPPTIPNTGFDIEFRFLPKTTSAFNSFFSPATANVARRFSVIATVDATNTIRNCGPIVSDTNAKAVVDFCGSLRNMAKMVAGKCVFNDAYFNCPEGRVPSSVGNDGKLSCVLIADRFDFDSVFDFSLKNCPAKSYSLYQKTDGRITVGCPNATEKIVDRALP